MVKFCYILDNYTICYTNVLDKIINNFPCLVSTKGLEDGSYEVYITCRVEDITSIEKILSPYV